MNTGSNPIVAIYRDGSVKLFYNQAEMGMELNIATNHASEIANGGGKKHRKSISGYRFRWPTEDELVLGKAIYPSKPIGKTISSEGFQKLEKPSGIRIRAVTRWVPIHCNCGKCFEFDYDAVISEAGENEIVKLNCPHCNAKLEFGVSQTTLHHLITMNCIHYESN